MKLTAPATASVPYAALAPPVTVSTDETTFSGNKLISGPPKIVDCTTRRPLSSCSVRLLCRPRRFSDPAPSVTKKLPGFCVVFEP
jgi:hypothetical protein